MSQAFIKRKIREAKREEMCGIFLEDTQENINYLESHGYRQWRDKGTGTIMCIDCHDEELDYVWLYDDDREDYLKVEI